MRRRKRDLLLVLVGMAANETLGHWWLGTIARDVLPIRIGDRWTITPEFNLALMIIWPVILSALVWFAWFKRTPEASPRTA
jgi:hypothetical protein